MRGFVREFWVYLLAAAILHGALVAFLVVSLERSIPVIEIDASPEPIEAAVVDAELVERELERIREAERRREQEVVDAQRAVEAAARAREQEEQRLREAQQQREREVQAARNRAERERVAEVERQRLAEAERQRQAEAERQRQAEAERQRQAEAERQRRETADRERREREARELVARERAQQVVLSQWMRDIQSKVQRNWNQPEQWPSGTSCTVRVSMIPGGEVVQARLLSSCGDPVRDRSVESAVLRASPLPMPSDPAVFRREIDLVFRPVN